LAHSQLGRVLDVNLVVTDVGMVLVLVRGLLLMGGQLPVLYLLWPVWKHADAATTPVAAVAIADVAGVAIAGVSSPVTTAAPLYPWSFERTGRWSRR
jgi:hypothetical protein